MKQSIVIALLLFSSSTLAQPSDQQRRPAYQGYGTTAPTTTPSPDFDGSSGEQVEASVKLKLEGALDGRLPAVELPARAAADAFATDQKVTADSETDPEPGEIQPALNTQTSADTQLEQPADEAQAEILAPIIESLPVDQEPETTPRVLVAPSATVHRNDDNSVQSVISPTEPSEFAEVPETDSHEVLQPTPAHPVKLSPARWQLDIVVFRTGGPRALLAERWDRNPGRPEIEQFDVVSDSRAESLNEVIDRLDASPDHRPLLQRTLVFEQLPDFLRTRGASFETTKAIVDADEVRGHSTMPTPASRFDWPEILGTVKLKQSSGLSVSVDLLFTYPTALPYRPADSEDPMLEGGFELPANENLYQLGHIRLQQTAAAKAGTLLYFDNPAIGAIVNITELAPQPLEPPPPLLVNTTTAVSANNGGPDGDIQSRTPTFETESDNGQIIESYEVEASGAPEPEKAIGIDDAMNDVKDIGANVEVNESAGFSNPVGTSSSAQPTTRRGNTDRAPAAAR